jgi:hypothetical protein
VAWSSQTKGESKNFVFLKEQAMAELKTKQTDQNVEEFLNSLPDERQRRDAFTILGLMKQATRSEPKMWGSSIIGLGSSHYKYESGREGDWFIIGFSPRKQNLTLYLNTGFDRYEEILKRLGKYKTGKACLYIKRIEDVDQAVLKELIQQSAEEYSRSST